MKSISAVSVLAALSATLVASGADGERGFKVNDRMTLRPYVSLSYTYDSNTDSGKHSKSSSSWVIDPGLDFDYKADNWSLNGAVFYQYHAYNRYGSELNSSSYGESLSFDWRDTAGDEPGWMISLTEKFQQISQDDDMSNDNGRGIGRDRRQISFDGIVDRQVNGHLSVGVMGGYYLLDYDNDSNKYAPLYGWKRANLGGQLGWALSQKLNFVLSGSYQWYWQDNDRDRMAGKHDVEPRGKSIGSRSGGYSVMGGLATRGPDKLNYRATVGWSRFEYGDGVADRDSFVYHLSANWKLSNTLHLMALGSSYYQPSEREYGSAVKAYTMSVGLGKSFIRGKLTGTLDLSYRLETNEYAEYDADDYDEDIWTIRLGLTYRLGRYVDVYGRIEYQDEETHGGSARSHEYDYDRWRGTVGMRLTY